MLFSAFQVHFLKKNVVFLQKNQIKITGVAYTACFVQPLKETLGVLFFACGRFVSNTNKSNFSGSGD